MLDDEKEIHDAGDYEDDDDDDELEINVAAAAASCAATTDRPHLKKANDQRWRQVFIRRKTRLWSRSGPLVRNAPESSN